MRTGYKKRPHGHKAAATGTGNTGRFRIIGGRWRGRRLSFPAGTGIRPSPDRVRETLFNWLQPRMPGARCLDLFAGSGALGLEALSRDAESVLFVDHHPEAVDRIREHLRLLDSDRGKTLCEDAEDFLEAAGTGFDVIFLDPPYREDLIPRLCTLIENNGWLATAGCVYVECESSLGDPKLPDGWILLRSKRAGQVGYHLAARNSG